MISAISLKSTATQVKLCLREALNYRIGAGSDHDRSLYQFISNIIKLQRIGPPNHLEGIIWHSTKLLPNLVDHYDTMSGRKNRFFV